LRIRLARVDDWPACAALDASFETEIAWQMAEMRGEGEMGARFREVRLPRKQHVQALLPAESRSKTWDARDGFFVAVERPAIIGYIAASLESDHRQARITDLVVAPEYRRQGIASALLLRLSEWALHADTDQLVLECPSKAQPAIGFALQHHFIFCGYQDSYWPGQEVALFFRLRLRK